MHEVLLELRRARYMVLRSLRLLLRVLPRHPGSTSTLLPRLLDFLEGFALSRCFPGEERFLLAWQEQQLRPDVSPALRNLQLQHAHAGSLTSRLRAFLDQPEDPERGLAAEADELVQRISQALIRADDLLEDLDLALGGLRPEELEALRQALPEGFRIDVGEDRELTALEAASHEAPPVSPQVVLLP